MNRKPPKNRTSNLPLALIGLGVVLLIGALVLTAIQTSERPAQSAALQGTATLAPAAQDTPEPQVKRVSLADAKAAYDTKAAVFVDVRDPNSYKAGHIPGSINIPVGEMETRYTELDASKWIITYCT